MVQSTNEDGVYYCKDDYAGVWLRLFIEAVDFVIAFTISILCTVVVLALLPQDDFLRRAILLTWVTIWFGYFVILKRTRIRTLEYLLGGVKVVNLRGAQPGIISLTIRLLFAVIGPINVIIDLVWISGDSQRQAMRDKLAGTYVIKNQAQPAGHGKIIYTSYSIMAWNFVFREVQEPAVTSSEAAG
jgi:hypothetical protein